MSRLPAFLCFVSMALGAEPVTLRLWERGAPGWENRQNREAVETGTDGQRRVRNVSQPTMKVFLPDLSMATGGAVIICPGGGYVTLSIDKEGEDVARWLNSFGVAAAVLRYRLMPTTEGEQLSPEERSKRREVHMPVALEDGKRAVRLVRRHAGEWKIDPQRVALMGFSAGGHLTANVAMSFDPGQPSALDPIERHSSRPDAVMPIYPGRFENPVFLSSAPPAFIVHAHDDKTVPSEYSTKLYDALKRAGVPADLHIYSKGGHGFGFTKTGSLIDQWPERMREWLDAQGWLRK